MSDMQQRVYERLNRSKIRYERTDADLIRVAWLQRADWVGPRDTTSSPSMELEGLFALSVYGQSMASWDALWSYWRKYA
jgi:hypothetical protein